MATPSTPSGHFHAVRFYDSADSLCRIVGAFLADGLNTDQPALVIATPEHRMGIVEALSALNLDADADDICAQHTHMVGEDGGMVAPAQAAS